MTVSDEWSIRGITRSLFPILVALTILELVGGLTLDGVRSVFLRYPTLLILVPVTIGTAGNLGSILASRTTTAFYLGTLSFDRGDEALVGNSVTTLLLAVTVFPVVGVAGWIASTVVRDPQLGVTTVVLVALVSGTVLAVLTVFVTVTTAYAAFRLGLDPDSVVIPVVTNVCDVLGVLVLVVVVRVLVV